MADHPAVDQLRLAAPAISVCLPHYAAFSTAAVLAVSLQALARSDYALVPACELILSSKPSTLVISCCCVVVSSSADLHQLLLRGTLCVWQAHSARLLRAAVGERI
jgi:hypothetical protein